jgi:hypothetical protein
MALSSSLSPGSEAGTGAGVGADVGVKPEASTKSDAGVSSSISVTVSSKTSSSMPGRLGGRLLSPTKIGQNVESMPFRPISTYCFHISQFASPLRAGTKSENLVVDDKVVIGVSIVT